MKAKRRKRRDPMLVAGLIERFDNHLLIVLPSTDEPATREWQFPRGAVEEGESPEAGLRRYCRAAIGLNLEVVVGQPPLRFEIEGQAYEVRYFFCGVLSGEPHTGPYREIRWVPRGHLREYEFDAVSRPVVEWLLEDIS